MKKYNTSLKFLLDDNIDMLYEGRGVLNPIRFAEQRAAKCILDIPDTYRRVFVKYLTGVKSAFPSGGEAYTKKAVEKSKDRESPGGLIPGSDIIGRMMSIATTFLGAAAAQLLTPENFQTILNFTNLFYMSLKVPAGYCEQVNIVFKILEPAIKMLLDGEEEQDQEKSEAVQLEYDATRMYTAYCKLVVLPNITDDVTYASKINALNIKFLKSSAGSMMQYAILLFEDFSKEIILNDNFDVNFLKQDIQRFDDRFRLASFRKNKAFDAASAFADFAESVGFDDSKISSDFNSISAKFEEFDKENENDAAAGEKLKKQLKNEYLDYLITIIEKIFYSPSLLNKIPNECKTELNSFLSSLKSKKER